MGMFNNLIDSPELRKMMGMSDDSGPATQYKYDPQTQQYTKMAKGGKVGSASKRADGIAQRGKTRGTMVMCGGGYAKGKK